MIARALVALAVTLAGVAALPGVARAEGAPAEEAIRTPMRAYFLAEKSGGIGFAGAGLAAAAIGGVLASRPEDFVRGMSYPILGVALIELVAGAWLYFRTDRLLRNKEAELRANPAAFYERERRYALKVNRQFRMVEGVEIALLFGGVATAAASAAADNDTWTGVGVGLAIQAAAMLALDHAAHRRSQAYLRDLEGLHLAISTERGQSRVMLGFQRAW